MSDDVKIQIGADVYAGWTNVSIQRSVDTVAGSFSMDIIDLWREENILTAPGESCKIFIGNDLVLTGYIDKMRPSIGPDSSGVSISGRCRTGDLVDCSVMNVPGFWKDIGLLKLAKAMLNPAHKTFGIDVLTDVDLGDPIEKFSADPGDSIYEALSKACNDRAVIPLSNEYGNLLLTRIGRNPASDDLMYGMNISSADSEINYVERFSEYVVKGQKSGKGESWNKNMTEKSAQAIDENITRYRPKVIVAEMAITAKAAQVRVNWEAQIRAGRSISVNVSLPGWRQSNGNLWKENQTVFTSIPKLRINEELLIREIEYRLSGTEKMTTMKLADPSIYAPQPKKIVKKKRQKKGPMLWK